MIHNQNTLVFDFPCEPMFANKSKGQIASFGLAEVGYDIRIKEDLVFIPKNSKDNPYGEDVVLIDGVPHSGHFTLASSVEKWHMPPFLVGVVHDKSTWARKGVSVNNTVIEPGWEGQTLTLEITFNGPDTVHIPAGDGIAQVIFNELKHPMEYKGKYQHANDKPQEAIEDKNS